MLSWAWEDVAVSYGYGPFLLLSSLSVLAPTFLLYTPSFIFQVFALLGHLLRCQNSTEGKRLAPPSEKMS